MAVDRSKITQKFERDIQIQKVKQKFDTLESLKKKINQRINSKAKVKAGKEEFDELLNTYTKLYDELNQFVLALDNEAQQEFAHTIKQLGSFLDKAKVKIHTLISEQNVEQASHVEEKTVQASDKEVQDVIKTKAVERRAAVVSLPKLPKKRLSVKTNVDEVNKETITPPKSPVIDVKHIDSDLSIETQESSQKIVPTQSINDLLVLIQKEKNAVLKKELAIKALLNLYAYDFVDADIINKHLHALLPFAYPEHFICQNEKLFIVGNDLSKIYYALGVKLQADIDSGVVLDCRQFDWVELEDLKIRFPNEKGLLSILQSLKPIDPDIERFTTDDKINACFEVLQELSKGKLIKTGKLNQALMILKFAGNIAREHEDFKGLSRVKNYFLKHNDFDSKDVTAFKTWFQRKIQSSKVKVTYPETIIDNWVREPQLIMNEKNALTSWFTRQNKQLKDSDSSEKIKKYKIELLYQIQEAYLADERFLLSIYQLKDIVKSRLEENEAGKDEYGLESKDKQILKKYMDDLSHFLTSYELFRESFPMPETTCSVEQALSEMINGMESDAFRKYQEMKENLSNSFLEMQRLNEKYNKFLDVHNMFDTVTPIEQRSLPDFDSYGIKFTQIMSQLGTHYSGMESNINKLNQACLDEKKKPAIAQETVVQFKAVIEYIKHGLSNINMRETETKAKSEAKRVFTEMLKQHNAQQAAVKSILSLYTDRNLKQSHSDVFINHYLAFLLPKAYPEHFSEINGELVISSDRNSRAIFEALGEKLSIDNLSMNLKVTKFDAHKLDRLKELYPSERGLWCILKSLKPLDKTFTAVDKINACLEVATELSKKEIIQTEKVKYTLDVLSLAYEEAKAYRVIAEVNQQSHLAPNVIAITIMADSFSYRVIDSSYKTQKGVIKFETLGLTENECTALQLLQKNNSDEATSLLNEYLPKILKVTTDLGHTYDKNGAMTQIRRAFKRVEEDEIDEQNQSVSHLRQWLKRELATKKTDVVDSLQDELKQSGIELPKHKKEPSGFSILTDFWQYLMTKFNKLVYDYFTFNKKSTEEVTPSVEPEVMQSEPKEALYEEQNTSDKFILDALLRAKDKQNRPFIPRKSQDVDVENDLDSIEESSGVMNQSPKRK